MSDEKTVVEVQKIHIKVDGLELEFTLEQLKAFKECLDNLFGTPQYWISSYQPQQDHSFVPTTRFPSHYYSGTTTCGNSKATWSVAPPLNDSSGGKI